MEGEVMKLCRFQIDGHARNGIVEDGFVVERNDSAERHPVGDVRLLAPVQPRNDLAIRTFVNGEQRQNGNTGEMVFNCFEQVAHLSEAFTLEPGDVIATGTPAGVGAARQPFPEGLLKVGDVVRIEIEGISELENAVIDEPDGYVVPEAEESVARLG